MKALWEKYAKPAVPEEPEAAEAPEAPEETKAPEPAADAEPSPRHADRKPLSETVKYM